MRAPDGVFTIIVVTHPFRLGCHLGVHCKLRRQLEPLLPACLPVLLLVCKRPASGGHRSPTALPPFCGRRLHIDEETSNGNKA